MSINYEQHLNIFKSTNTKKKQWKTIRVVITMGARSLICFCPIFSVSSFFLPAVRDGDLKKKRGKKAIITISRSALQAT